METTKTLQLSTFWQQGIFDSFQGVDRVEIHFTAFNQAFIDAPSIVVVPGRSESYLKYQELAFELYEQGYSIFIIDHRGQGLSGRLLDHKNKGYVKHFQDYVADLRTLVENVIPRHSSTKPYLLAHSMGGAIATRLMQDAPEAIKAAVISSPMLGFNSGALPEPVARVLVKSQQKLNSLISKTPWYFFGQSDYQAISFADNRLSHCPKRYQSFYQLYESNNDIQLGGVTGHWLLESIAAQQEIFSKIALLKTPLLLLQAGSDSVVSLQAQDDFCQQLHREQPLSCPEGKPVKIDGAYHELFFELDKYRDVALTQTLAWFKAH